MLSYETFFRLFPPPTYLTMPYAGLDMSDDAISFVAYDGFGRNRRLSAYASVDLPVGLLDGGDIKDEKEFASRLKDFARKNGLSRVKASVPEEKSYLFQTDVPQGGGGDAAQNIEFKLEENVPLSASDAVFYFDILPFPGPSAVARASVSVVPRTYVDYLTGILRNVGLLPVAFETVPKAVARAIVSSAEGDTKLVINIMARKVGMYVIAAGVVCFASTISRGNEADGVSPTEIVGSLGKEINKVCSYWASHGSGGAITEAVLVGRGAGLLGAVESRLGDEAPLTVRPAEVWKNAIDIERHLPAISQTDSLEYAVAAGLALGTGSLF